jgi:hypothetical protein
MPFFATEGQTLSAPIPCDGACAFVEIPASIFVPGAQGWDQVLELEEYSLMMQLWLFWIEILRSIDAHVVLETLVTNEFEGLHESKMSRLVHVVGYRLWAVMSPTQLTTLLKQITVTIANNVADDPITEDRTKRRRVEPPLVVPLFKQNVKTKAHLLRLVRLYHSGLGAPITDLAFTQTPNQWDEGAVGTKTLVDHFDMNLQFKRTSYHERAALSDLYKMQHDPTNYIHIDSTGCPVFFPSASIRTTGIIRAFQLGGGGFLEASSQDLLSYMLPQMAPTTAELRSKLERCLSAVGSFVSLRNKTREELIRTADSTDPGMFSDPHDFSAITAHDTLGQSRDLVSMGIEEIARAYPTAQELHDRNAVRLRYLTKTHNVKGTAKFFKDMVNNIHLVFSGNAVDGIPLVLGELHNESRDLYEMIHGEERWLRKAKAIFTINKKRRGYTGMSNMLNKLFVLSRESLLLMPQQQMVFILMVLRSFTTTRHLEVICTMILLAGKPDTGKSHAMNTFMQCCAQSLIVREGSTSELAGTDGNNDSDLRIRITDEYRRTQQSGGEAKDSGSGTRTKNEQQRMSGGCVYHGRLVRDPTTGEYSTVNTKTVQRLLEYAGTNMPQDITPAMASRMTMIPVTSSNSDTISKTLRSGGMASSMVSDEDVAEDMQACKQALRLLSSLQIRTTAPEAFGALPSLDTTCFRIFLAIVEQQLGKDALATRRKNDLLRLAHAIKVWNDTTLWHSRGLADRFDHDDVVELQWIASRQFLRMEEIVVAYSLLEQTRSLDAFIEEIMMTLKLSVLVVNGEMADTDEYYLSEFTRDRDLMRRVDRGHSQLGDGICSKCIAVMQMGSTNKLPNIERIKDHEGLDRIAFHKEWLCSVNTPLEDAIILVLQRLISEKSQHVMVDYDTETRYVFSAAVRKTFVNPMGADVIPFPELVGEPKAAIRHAFIMLENRRVGGKPLVSAPLNIDTAKFVDEGHNGAEPCTVHRGRYKIVRKTSGLVIEPQLFEKAKKSSVNIDIIRTALLVAGGYNTGESRVFIGMDPTQAPDDLSDNFVCLEPADTTSITIPNMYYRHKTLDRVIYGGADGLSLAASPEHFPADQPSVTFDETSQIERSARERAMAKIALAPEIAEIFLTADVDH